MGRDTLSRDTNYAQSVFLVKRFITLVHLGSADESRPYHFRVEHETLGFKNLVQLHRVLDAVRA